MMDLWCLIQYTMGPMILGLSPVFMIFWPVDIKLPLYSVSVETSFLYLIEKNPFFLNMFCLIDVGSNVVSYPQAALRALQSGHTLCAQ